MSVLSRENQVAILAALVDGNSEHAIERMTEAMYESAVHRQTIRRFALLVGAGAQRLHDRLVRDLSCSLIEIDEIWSYVGKKQARLTAKDPADFGDCYTFTALSRMVITWHAGKRDQENTDIFIADLRSRLLVMPQMTSDGFPCYPSAIGASFGPGVDYAQMHKTFKAGGARDDDYRTEQPRNPIVTKHAIFGAPDMGKVSTSYAERQNGTQRTITGRIRRHVYAFSKRLPNHRAALAIGYCWYNLGRVVRTLRVTPAMQASVTDHIWTLEEFMDACLSEPAGEKPSKKPLAHRVPEETARELPNGRGFLRVISGGRAAPPAPRPEAPTPAPVAPSAPVEVTASDDRQLTIWDYQPRPAETLPAPGTQLDLFDEPLQESDR